MGYEDFVDFFLGSSKNWTIFRGHFYAFYGGGVKVKVQNGGIFLGSLIFQIFIFGCLKFLIFLGVNGRC